MWPNPATLIRRAASQPVTGLVGRQGGGLRLPITGAGGRSRAERRGLAARRR